MNNSSNNTSFCDWVRASAQKNLRWLYGVIGPSVASRLSSSHTLRLLLRPLISPRKGVYHCSYDIMLKLPREDAEAYGVAYLGVINPVESRFISRYLKNGMTVFDIGTYIDGWYTILASKLVGQTGHVYSFEPVPDHFSGLKENISINGCNNVTAEMICLGISSQNVDFAVNGGFSHMLRQDDNVAGVNVVRNVKMSAIDDYVVNRGIKALDFIKIDTEGAEVEILKGGVSSISKNRPLALVEVVADHLKTAGSSISELYDYFKDLNYISFSVRRNSFVESNYSLESETPNVLFVPGEKKDVVMGMMS